MDEINPWWHVKDYLGLAKRDRAAKLLDQVMVTRAASEHVNEFVDGLLEQLNPKRPEQISEAEALQMSIDAAVAIGQGSTDGVAAAKNRVKYLRFLESVGLKDG